MPVESTARARASRGSHRYAWLALSAVACLIAYRGIVVAGLDLSGTTELQLVLFAPSHLSPLMLVAVAGWLLWNRRGALADLPAASNPPLALAAWLLGLAMLGWAVFSQMGHLLLPSLAFVMLAWAAWERGGAGCLAVALPAIVLILGHALPGPLLDEAIWRLQTFTAAGATWLLQTGGFEVQRSGTMLVRPLGRFEVIDACSGLRGLQLLTVVALIVRDLFGRRRGWGWLPVLLAPPLAMVLNVVRVAVIAANPDPAALQAEGNDHTVQGLVVVAAGTLILYGLAFATRARNEGVADDGAGEALGARPEAAAEAPRDTRFLAAAAILLAAVSLTGLVFGPRAADMRPPPLSMPMQAGAWTGEKLDVDVLFYGVPAGSPSILLRRYETKTVRRVPFAVDLFVGRDGSDAYRRSSFFTTKFDRPGAEWEVVDAQPTRIGVLDVDGCLLLATRPLDGSWAIAYRFDVADAGRLRAAFRSYLGLDVVADEAPDRLTLWVGTAIPSDAAVDRRVGQKRLDRFLRELRSDLASLQAGT